MLVECKEYEIPLWKFLEFIHGSTERAAIKVVCGGPEAMEDKVREHYLTKNAFKSPDEKERLLKYYKDVSLWNLHIEYEFIYDNKHKGTLLTGVLVANCSYKDVREKELLERNDIKKAKRRAYDKKRRQEKLEGDK